MDQIALVGAAGAIGQSIATALDRESRPYRVVGRNRAGLESTFGKSKNAEVVTWDPADSASARAALRGMNTLIYLIGVPYDQFRLHPVVMRQTLDAAIAEGVDNFVLIGTVYPYGLPQTTPVAESHPRQPNTFKGEMRKAQEDTGHQKPTPPERFAAPFSACPISTARASTRVSCTASFRQRRIGGTANMLGPIEYPA